MRPVWRDIKAGAVGALVNIPQAIAYGLIAFAPLGASGTGEGLRAAFITAVIFALWAALTSHSPTLICGPRAMTALLVSGTIADALQEGAGTGTAIAAGFAAVSLSGLIQIGFGLARLGRLVAFVPNPVLLGFLNASALLVVLSQIPIALGLGGSGLSDIAPSAIIPEAAILAAVTAAITILLNPHSKVLPSALLGLAAATAAAYLLPVFGTGFTGFTTLPTLDLSSLGSAALPDPTPLASPTMWLALWPAILPAAFAMALLASFDSVLSLAALGTADEQTANPDGELLRQGLGNVLMGIVGGLPGSGTLTRSIAIRRAGATGRTAPVLSALFTGAAALGLGGLLGLIPLAVSAGLLIGTSLLALDGATLRAIGRLLLGRVEHPRLLLGDLSVMAAVLAVALLFGLIAAVGVGILLAALLFVFGLGRGLIRRVQRGDRVRSRLLRPAEELKALEEQGHAIRLIELEGALFFGSCDLLEAQAKLARMEGVRYLILDLRRLNSIDSTGASCLARLADGFRNAGGALLLAHLEREQRHPQPETTPFDGRERRHNGGALRWLWLKLAEHGAFKHLADRDCFPDADSALADAESRLLHRLGLRKNRNGSFALQRGLAMLQGLDRREIAILARQARRRRVQAGETVFRKGDRDQAAWLLLSGQVEIRLPIPGSARSTRLATVVPGGVFGEMAMLDGQPRSADVVATEASLCVGLDAEGYAAIRANEPELALKLTANLCRLFADRLRLANTMIAELER